MKTKHIYSYFLTSLLSTQVHASKACLSAAVSNYTPPIETRVFPQFSLVERAKQNLKFYPDIGTTHRRIENFGYATQQTGDRVLLFSNDLSMAKALLRGLFPEAKAESQLFKIISNLSVKVAENPGVLAFDITSAAEITRYLHLLGKTAIYDQARCYSAVCFAESIIGGIGDVGSSFLGDVLRSPLYREVPRSEAKKGDIAVFGPGEAGDHVAVLLSPHLLFQKGGAPSEWPFTVRGIDAMVSYYGAEKPRFYQRRKLFSEYIRIQAKLTGDQELIALSELIPKTESQLERYILHPELKKDHYIEPDDAFWEKYQDFVDHTSSQFRPFAEKAHRVLQGKDRDDEDYLFWSYLYHRSEHLAYLQGPYD